MDVLVDNEEQVWTRFQSECYEPGCAIDVVEEKKVAKGHRFVEIYFWATPAGWWDRVRWCWGMARWGIGFEHEFIVREEDIESLARAIKGVNNGQNSH